MMRYRILFGVMAWGAASISLAAPLTPAQQAFSDAQALAAGAQASAAANVSNGSVEATVNQFNPTYYNSTGTAPESALFQNGKGNTVSAGQTKVADCATGAADPDPFLRQNCEAINLMVNNPSNRPQISIPPSLFAASRAIEAKGVTDPNAAGSFTSCVNKTVESLQATEICREWFGTASQQCTIGRVVQVDASTNYQCDKTAATYLPQSCYKTLNVTVTQPAPIPATATVTSFIQGTYNVIGSSACDTAPFDWQCNTTGLVYQCANDYEIPVIEMNYPCPSITTYSYSCPAGTTLTGSGAGSMCVYPPVVSSSTNNGCSVLEAAAL